MNKKIIIIGAGPAGLFTAIQAKNKDNEVIILEKNSKAGRKLLMSGAGQCNITHSGEVAELLEHYGEEEYFLISALYQFSNRDLLSFFEKRGIEFSENEEGKIFPNTYKSQDILNILLKECEQKNINIKYNQAVKKVNFLEEENTFNVVTENKVYSSQILVIAVGGQSYPGTGSSGDGYKFAAEIGHNIKQVKPALTPVYIKNYLFSDLAGISLENAEISLWRGNKLQKRWSGDILFTHNGLSGPGIINYSRYIECGDILKIMLVEAENEAELDKIIREMIKRNGSKNFKNILKSFEIPERLIIELLKTEEISKNKKAAQINKNERWNIVKKLYSLEFEVKKLGSFKEAMVTKGGIDLNEIDPSTMESKLRQNLFSVGEVLDIDGDTGGYNLQAAFSTAYLAGKEIAERTLNN